jgi:plastocyanin
VRRALATVLVSVALIATSAPAQAVTTVQIGDFFFSPTPVKVAQGGTVAWHNGGSVNHTSTQNGPLSLWSSGTIHAGSTSASVLLRAAGAYPYHCAIHASMKGTVQVPLKVSPTSGSPSTTFTLTLASATQAGFVYDVQRAVGSGSFQAWRTGVSTRTVTFSRPTGTYRFRSRLRKVSSGATSGYSAAKKITVS